jgi:hypothetical protein
VRHRKDINEMPGGVNEAQPLVDPNIRGMNANSVFRTRDAQQQAARNPYNRDLVDFGWLTR